MLLMYSLQLCPVMNTSISRILLRQGCQTPVLTGPYPACFTLRHVLEDSPFQTQHVCRRRETSKTYWIGPMLYTLVLRGLEFMRMNAKDCFLITVSHHSLFFFPRQQSRKCFSSIHPSSTYSGSDYRSSILSKKS